MLSDDPPGFHFCITSYHNNEIIDNFVDDMRYIIENENLKRNSSPCIYGP